MNRFPRRFVLPAVLAAATVLALVPPAAAQFKAIVVPPNGGNQRATVIQNLGLVRLSIDYSSPHVHSPSGEDRKGKIWGKLVPYGLADLNFGTCGDQCPWRGGANENTVFTTSHDIKVQGQPLPAGAYGLHFIPGPEEWTVIFSKNSTSWGSFYYHPEEDALRVKAKPEPAPYREVLTYEFPERRLDRATLALEWENLALPLSVTVDNALDLYVESMARDLRSASSFNWQGWNTAADFCLQNKTHLDQGLLWAERGIDRRSGGEENFTTLLTLADLQAANGRAAEAEKTRDRALNHATAQPFDLHAYGRQLLTEKKPQEAMKVFEINARRHPDVWPVHGGLARGYAALGDKKKAVAEARLALQQAPDAANRKIVEDLIRKIEKGEALD